MSSATYSEDLYNSHGRNVDELEKDVQEYPFSSLARLLLLSHYKKVGDPGFQKAAQTTAVYFTNQRWLAFELLEIGSENMVELLEKLITENQEQHPEEITEGHFAVAKEEELLPLPTIGAEEDNTPAVQTLGDHIESPEGPAMPGDVENSEKIALPETETLGEHLEHTNVGQNGFQVGESESLPELLPETGTLGSHGENDNETGEQLHEHRDEVVEEQHSLPAAVEIPDSEAEEIQESGVAEEQTEQVVSPGFGEGKASNMGNDEGVPEPLAFEPMHTVDYFASQGIRVPDEGFTNDKLGTQMKSFTEWLKSMKKVQAEKLQEENTLAEDIIKSAAEVSNIDTEVLTEAMAEVLIKQDKREKAIEMYNKLSLINPSKSAYFAAKIESIKST